jgi:hypothetical protein
MPNLAQPRERNEMEQIANKKKYMDHVENATITLLENATITLLRIFATFES